MLADVFLDGVECDHQRVSNLLVGLASCDQQQHSISRSLSGSTRLGDPSAAIGRCAAGSASPLCSMEMRKTLGRDGGHRIVIAEFDCLAVQEWQHTCAASTKTRTYPSGAAAAIASAST
jgi:hypothetical protein